MTTQTTSPAANAELVRAGFRAFNAGDADECLTYTAPDLVINLAELPEAQHGRQTWRQGFEMMRRAFPDLRAHIEDIVAAQDTVAVRVRFRGTHSGEFLGFSPTGRSVGYVSHEFLPHRRRAHRRGMDLPGHGHPVPPAQLIMAFSGAGERARLEADRRMASRVSRGLIRSASPAIR